MRLTHHVYDWKLTLIVTFWAKCAIIALKHAYKIEHYIYNVGQDITYQRQRSSSQIPATNFLTNTRKAIHLKIKRMHKHSLPTPLSSKFRKLSSVSPNQAPINSNNGPLEKKKFHPLLELQKVN